VRDSPSSRSRLPRFPLRFRHRFLMTPRPTDADGPGDGKPRARQIVEASVSRVRMYTTSWCGYCDAARRLLDQLGVEFEEIDLDHEPAFRQRLFDLTGGWTVPQIVIDDRCVGGYTELRRLFADGRLAPLAA
jgi:glutaredoxin 3